MNLVGRLNSQATGASVTVSDVAVGNIPLSFSPVNKPTGRIIDRSRIAFQEFPWLDKNFTFG
jgi:hypothetical protein